jgi:Tfp pilus assembly protein PilO
MDTGATLIQAIPFSAWEQAVFVALFIVLVIGLLAWFGKQSDKWQKFIDLIDEKWRKFNKEQREENNCAMAELRASLIDLTTVTQGLVHQVKEMREDDKSFYSDFHVHGNQTKEILNRVKNSTKPAAYPRVKKNINGD